jgi:thiol-disulfide isomerase/thioredoxin
MSAQDEFLKDVMGNTSLTQIKNGLLENFDLIEQTRGKVTIIELWEAWCGPCITAMRKLRELKHTFPNELEVICVSSENTQRTIAFIERNNFPFTFVHHDKRLKNIFPHTGIPHSILIDRNGKILAQTHPNSITEEVIHNLINDLPVDIPRHTTEQSNQENLSNENTLITFKLSRFQPGTRQGVGTSSRRLENRILTDAGEYENIVENVAEIDASGQPILALYQYAFNISSTRFIYAEELNYLSSVSPENLYNMTFLSSDLLGNHHSLLVNQLNNVFGLSTSTQKKETEVLVLDSICINNENISWACDSNIAFSQSTRIGNFIVFFFNSLRATPQDITRLLESFFAKPVVTDMSAHHLYEIYVDIDSENMDISGQISDIDFWLEEFKKHGLFLKKEQRFVEFIEIKKI